MALHGKSGNMDMLAAETRCSSVESPVSPAKVP